MELNTSLELYDSKVISGMKRRFYSISGANWNFAPPDLAFEEAYKKFGDSIFPLYNVFRQGVPMPADERSSIGNFTLPLRTSQKNKTIEFYKVFLTYQIDIYSNSMYDMNLSVLDFYRFKKQRELIFSFEDIGLEGEEFPSEVMFEDPEDNSGIDDSKIHETGRYFRYTYILTLEAIIFDIRDEVLTESIVTDFYERKDIPQQKVTTVTTQQTQE